MLSGFYTLGKNKINAEIEKQIKQFDKYIYFLIHTKGFRVDEKEDCYQYVSVAIAKSYKNRYKYKDWNNLVKIIIERRITDYSKHTNTFNNHITTEADLSIHSEEPDEYSYCEAVSNGVTDTRYEVCELFSVLLKKIINHSEEVFDEWDIAFTEKLVHYAQSSIFNLNVILNDDELVELGRPFSCDNLFDKYKIKLKENNLIEGLGVW